MHRGITDMSIAGRCVAAVCAAFALASSVHAAPLLHSIFSDHVVVQRDQPINVWGRAEAGSNVTVSLASKSVTATTDARGNWKAQLPAMSAGGPHVLSARSSSGATQTVNDVLVGEVWLCSGQSNMQLQVHRALDSRSEIADSTNDSIRMLTIPLVSDIAAQDELPATEWQVAGPQTAAEFSAACFFLARELQKTVPVPFGLINSSWGGSRIEAWMSNGALRAAGGYDSPLDALQLRGNDVPAATARWSTIWESWWHAQPSTNGTPDPWSAPLDARWRAAPAELTAWETWRVPELQAYNGMLWYRASVKLSASQARQRARLSLGRVDEADVTWINAKAQGATSPPSRDAESGFASLRDAGRVYYLPQGALKAGENVIVVNVLDTYGAGGLYGPAENRVLQFADGTSVPLGQWHYQMAPASIGAPPREPWGNTAGLGTIYNAMIAPLTSYSLRGVAWYQGESNTGEASRYRDLLTRFMGDWRKQFDAPRLPFLIVQLANYGPAPTAPVESGWAELREAQRLAVNADPHAALAVTIDIGDRYDIHPANKQELGRRLARAARHLVYGESLAASGPVAASARQGKDGIVVTFDDVARRLVTYSSAEPIGFELCGAALGSCRFARARISGNLVVLDTTQMPAATRVRYCWADSPVCTLFDEDTLPAGPFELPIDANASRPE